MKICDVSYLDKWSVISQVHLQVHQLGWLCRLLGKSLCAVKHHKKHTYCSKQLLKV